jgi:hypothetical protein
MGFVVAGVGSLLLQAAMKKADAMARADTNFVVFISDYFISQLMRQA